MDRWFLRLLLIARNPPSRQRVRLIGAVVIIAIVIAALEYFQLWPDWATAERIPRTPIQLLKSRA